MSYYQYYALSLACENHFHCFIVFKIIIDDNYDDNDGGDDEDG